MTSYNATNGSGRANLWQDWTNLFLGIWLFVSPWVFQLPNDSVVAWNAWISGGIIAMIAAAALYQVQKWEEWTNAIVGIFIANSPWVLGFSHDPVNTWNAVEPAQQELAESEYRFDDAAHRFRGLFAQRIELPGFWRLQAPGFDSRKGLVQ